MNDKKFDWRQDKEARKRLRLIWRLMKLRCDSPNDKYYHRYVGRGIKVCKEWYDFDNFCDWAYESGYDPYAEYGECTLDRIDNNGDYCPENCKWSTIKEQTRNTSRNHQLTYKGITHCLIDWVAITGGKHTTIYKRAELGMSPAEVLYPDKLPVHRTEEKLEEAVDELLRQKGVLVLEAMK